MKIGELKNLVSNLPGINPVEKSDNTEFENVIGDFIGAVNKDQQESAKITKDFVMGEDVELHDVMIASEKAKTSLELLMEIRNKAVDMYKELIRMNP